MKLDCDSFISEFFDMFFGSNPARIAKKSRETPVFLLFFTLLADPNRRPCHTQPHRLLTGSEHRAACGR